ncbi:hypothetical protein GGR51DRAFT_507359 [Nemania sp. FL0031]|nr:hypothetical protein GGR51DRAFT_507359 [Nemania sp. FL0031]
MPYIKPKPTKFLVPARDSRHRIACFALYRALLRLAPRITLPDDLATGWGAGKNPITLHIQRAFRRNVADTSPRIVYPALSAGYRMLTLLHDAATSPSSAHHASITSFLRARLAERQRSLANRGPPPGIKPAAPRPGTIPLLVNISPPPSRQNPNPAPEYTTPSRPRAQSELGGTGRRKVPRLEMANSFPFLRLTKPEPVLLSRVLAQKVVRRAEREFAVRELTDEALPDAYLEDRWDEIVAEQLRAEQPANRNRNPNTNPFQREREWRNGNNGHNGTAGEHSHASTVRQHGIGAVMASLTREHVDMVARADAMRRLIIEEKALVAKEKAERDAERRARWEARMREEHGERWRDLFPKLKEIDQRRAERRVSYMPSARL